MLPYLICRFGTFQAEIEHSPRRFTVADNTQDFL
jgi:hypothetical protein